MNKNLSYICLALACVFGLISLDTCMISNSLKSELGIISQQNNSLVKQRLSDSSSIYSMQQKISLNEVIIHDQNNKLMAFEIMNMRRPREVVGIGTRTRTAFSVQLPSPIKIDSSSDKYLKLPVPISDSSKWHTFAGKIDTSGIFTVDSLVTRANFTYAVGDTAKKGILNRVFRKTDTVVRLRIDNPNVQLTGFDNIYIKQKTHWYQRPGLMIATGFIAGTVTGIIIFRQK